MTPKQKIAAAEADVAAARAQLIDTIQDVASTFEPKKIVREMWEGAKVKGADLAEDAVDAVKKRPMAVGGALAALTMFLAREPLKDGVSNFYQAMNKRKKPAAKPATTTADKAKGSPAKASGTASRNTARAPAVQTAKKPARPARPRKAATKTVEKAS